MATSHRLLISVVLCVFRNPIYSKGVCGADRKRILVNLKRVMFDSSAHSYARQEQFAGDFC